MAQHRCSSTRGACASAPHAVRKVHLPQCQSLDSKPNTYVQPIWKVTLSAPARSSPAC
ncbi:uncharacterized protein EI90DRAFT_3073615, partial [Cantharellus anzutake]|uniref:uncharacterized protein n=1 Tax=Cantharellus anzutake TaxID=1750568 RepID=UPI001908D8BF